MSHDPVAAETVSTVPDTVQAVEAPAEKVTAPVPEPPEVDSVRVSSTPTGPGTAFTVSVDCVPMDTAIERGADDVAT